MIEVKEVLTKKDKKKFFKFYIDLYKGSPYATPNLYSDELPEFDPKENDAFRFADCRMFLAYKNGKIAGRIAAIHHRGVNEKFGYKQVRFTRFDFIDDLEVSKALFEKVCEWAKELEMTEIIGPMGFSDLNEEGMLIDGFDKEVMYIEIYNHEYYIKHMEALGAYKVVDWNCYRIKVPEKHDERLKKLSALVAERNGFELVDIAYLLKHDRKKLDEYMMKCLTVLDEAFADLYGTSPINDKQKAREMKTVYMALVPEFAAIVTKGEDVVAYGFMMPSMTKVLQKARGNVFPKGILPYMNAMKHPEVVDLMSIGVAKKYSNLGAVAMIIDSCLAGLIKRGSKYIETGPELENNNNVQNLWKNYNPELVKRHRCWGVKV
ncbi:MAG: hypothetical protein J1G05_03715 [Clostridiales bacterium]|nr:hypothetical protein [Clostridiales bacterium]